MTATWEVGKSGLLLPTEPVAQNRGLIIHAFVGEFHTVQELINRGHTIALAVDPDAEKVEQYRSSFGKRCTKLRVVAQARMTSSALFPKGAPTVTLLMGSPSVLTKAEDPTGRTFDQGRSQILVFARLVRALRPHSYLLSPESLIAMSKLVDSKGKPLLDVFVETMCRDGWTSPESAKRSLLSNKEAFANYDEVLSGRRPNQRPKQVAERGQQTEIDFGIGLSPNNEEGESTLF